MSAAAAGLFYYMKHYFPSTLALENEILVGKEPGSYVEGLPVYTSDEVAKHQDEKTGIWVSYKSGVYDITKFVKKHPGISSSMSLFFLLID